MRSVVKRGGSNFWGGFFLGNGKQITIVDNEDLLQTLSDCHLLNTIIGTGGDMLTNGVLKKRNRKTKKVNENARIPDWLLTPNPTQNFKEYVKEWYIYFNVFANYYIYPNRPFPKSEPKTIFNLLPSFVKITTTGKYLDQVTIDGMIKKIEFNVNGNILKTFKPSELVWGKDGVSKNPFMAESKLIGLQFPISNSVGSLKTRNRFIYNGAKGIISSKQGDGDGGVPLGEPERKEIEMKIQSDYGIRDNQSSTIVATSQLSYSAIDPPTREMMLFEEDTAAAEAICGALGMNKYMFPYFKDSTFENQKKGEIATYQNKIIPSSETLAAIFDEIDNDTVDEYFFDFSHLPVLQEDKQAAATENKTNVEAYSIMLRDGIISPERYSELAGEPKFTGDKVIQQQNNNSSNGKS